MATIQLGEVDAALTQVHAGSLMHQGKASKIVEMHGTKAWLALHKNKGREAGS